MAALTIERRRRANARLQNNAANARMQKNAANTRIQTRLQKNTASYKNCASASKD
jgi:hypothetical protein